MPDRASESRGARKNKAPFRQVTAPISPNPSPIAPEEALQAATELQAFRALEARNTRKRKGRIVRVALLILALLAVLAVAYAFLSPLLFPPSSQAETVPSDVVTKGDYVDSTSGGGSLAAYESVVVTPEVDGTIAELFVAEGDIVGAGQTLFTIDAPELDDAIKQAERGLTSANLACTSATQQRDSAVKTTDDAKASYYELESTLNQARQTAQAAGEPFDEQEAKAQLVAAWKEYESLLAQQAPAQQQLDTTYLQLEEAQATLEKAKQASEKRTVTAPISGQIVTINIERGMKLSTLASSGSSPLRIADLSRMRITLNVNELDISKLKVDQAATVTFDALPDYVADATVKRIAAISSSGSSADTSRNMGPAPGAGVVTFPVEIVIEKPDPRLKIGMSAQAEITIEEHKGVLLVNTLALQSQDGNHAFVEVQGKDNERRQVQVTVIAKNNYLAAVSGPLAEGDVVFLSAASSDLSFSGEEMSAGGIMIGG